MSRVRLESMEPASTPHEEAPAGFNHPVLINSPLTGMCRGAAAVDPRSGMGLWFITEAEVKPGSYCPVKISDVDAAETVTTMGRVVEAQGSDAGNIVIMSLPREDEKLVRALTTWFPLPTVPTPAPLALGGTGAAPMGAAQPPPAVDQPDAPRAPLPAGLQHVGPEEHGEEVDLTDLAETLSQGQKKAVNNEIVRFQYDSLISEADRLEAQGQYPEAFARVEKALSIYPIYADDLHVRLAKLAMANEQLALALKHAESARSLNPSRRDADHLIRQINTQRSSRLNADAAKTRRIRRRGELANTLGAVALFILVIAPTAAYNIYTYLIPHGPQPEALSPDSFTDVLAADRILLQDDVVYFFVGSAWQSLDKKSKQGTLEELAARANRLLNVQRIVITSAEPRLLATANAGRTKVYR